MAKRLVFALFPLLALLGAQAPLRADCPDNCIPQSERDALIALYNATDGPHWTNKSNWLGAPGTEGTWYGIGADAGGGSPHVKVIHLSHNNLVGSLPAQIGDLPFVTDLDLSNNHLSSGIPHSIGNLAQLDHLSLSDNQFSGGIPVEIGNLTKMVEMGLNRNDLSGPIPDGIGNMLNLYQLRLSNNQLTSIPNTIGNLTHLEQLGLEWNEFSGPIPGGIFNLSNLVELRIGQNNLSGGIPAEIGNLSQLQILDLAANQLAGPFPLQVCNLDRLQSFDLSGNLLSGALPPEIGNLSHLQGLVLKFNQFTGSIPDQVGNLLELQGAFFSGNQLTGTIPASLGSLLQLKQLDLWGNLLSGEIPAELGNLPLLEGLWLGNNQLTGAIPASLGDLTHLKTLEMVGNHLSGEVPSALGNLSNLSRLELAANKLTGELPASLADLPLDPAGYGSPNGFIGWNGVHSVNPALRDFLSSIDPNWESTQTVAPKDVTAQADSASSIMVSWTPILYTEGPGGYEVFYSTASGDPDPTLAGITPDKTSTGYEVSNLAPSTVYYFSVKAVTYPYDLGGGYIMPNTVVSEPSEEVSAATMGLPPPCLPLPMDPSLLPSGMAGTPYGPVGFTMSGAAGTIVWSESGALPGGMTFSSGTLWGTPTQTGSFPITVTATDAVRCVRSKDYTLTVICPTIVIGPASLPSGAAGTAYAFAGFTQAGGVGPITWGESGALPTGMTFASGTLSGTPTQTGSFPILVTATDANGCTGTRSYTLVIACGTILIGPASLPSGTAGTAYASTGFTQAGGVGTVTWGMSGALPSGMIFSNGTLSGTPMQTGSFPMTVTATDANGCTGSRAFALVIACPTISVSPASLPPGTLGAAYPSTSFAQGGGVGTVTWGVSGALPSGMIFASGTLSGTPTQTGNFPITVTATDANACTGSKDYTLAVACPTITVSPAALPSGTVGTAYLATGFTQTGGVGTVTWSEAGALPAGMTFSNGTLSGTPSRSGSFPITVTATDANACTGSKGYTLTIGCPAITLVPDSLPPATVGLGYHQSLTAAGGVAPYAFSVTSGALQPGLTLSPDGTLSGSPIGAGDSTFVITATDSLACAGSRTYSITSFACPAITLFPPGGSQTLSAGWAYHTQFAALGGLAPYTFTYAGTLPPGVTLSPDGLFAGTPTTVGHFGGTVTATDALGCTGSDSYTLIVVAPPVITAIKKSSPPFQFVVTGSNLQQGIQVFLNYTGPNPSPWSPVIWKKSSKVVIGGGAALKAKVPKGIPTNIAFLNPDGGVAAVNGWHW